MDKSLVERLQELRQCFDMKLVDEEQYKQTQREILSSFSKISQGLNHPLASPIQRSTPSPKPYSSKNRQSLPLLFKSDILDLQQGGENEGENEAESTNLMDMTPQVLEQSMAVSNLKDFEQLLEMNDISIGQTVKEPAILMEHNALNSSLVEINEDNVTNTTALPFECEVETTTDVGSLTVDQFWSLVLQTPIPEGKYYPLPEDATETARIPFTISKALISSLISEEVQCGLLQGASIVLRTFHSKVFGLSIPWCIEKTFRSDSAKYAKATELTIDFYCPWNSCEVLKRWIFVDPELLQNEIKKKRLTTDVNIIKRAQLQRFVDAGVPVPADSFVVVEILGQTATHTHLKGSEGGVRIHVKEALKEYDLVKDYFKKQASKMTGNVIKLFAKSVAPIIVMAQNILINLQRPF